DNLVVTAHGFADVRTQPVEAFDPTTAIPRVSAGSSPANRALEVGEAQTQRVGPTVMGEGAAIGPSQLPEHSAETAPDWLLHSELMPPPAGGLSASDSVPAEAGFQPAPPGASKPRVGTTVPPSGSSPSVDSTVPLASRSAPTETPASSGPTASSFPPAPSVPPATGTPPVAAQSRQVPPEVAHYMAYMDRQSASAPSAMPQGPSPSQQQGQAPKSRLLRIPPV